MLKLPSEVIDRNYLRVPDTNRVVDSDDEWAKCGKWVLSNATQDMSWIDETWSSLQVLVEKGILLMLKASTSAMKGMQGVVLCYTRPGEEEIERTAKEIREIVCHEKCMYYKINKMTEVGFETRQGYKAIASYMHTFKGFFYRRRNEDWTLIGDSNNRSLNIDKFLSEMNLKDSEDTDFALLPSWSRTRFLGEVPKHYCEMTMHTICSLEQPKSKLSEADRLWILGEKFVKEKIVSNITYELVSGNGRIILYFPKKLDDGSLVDVCRQIHFKAQVFCFLRIKIGNTILRYSPEGELYRDHKFVMFYNE